MTYLALFALIFGVANLVLIVAGSAAGHRWTGWTSVEFFFSIAVASWALVFLGGFR